MSGANCRERLIRRTGRKHFLAIPLISDNIILSFILYSPRMETWDNEIGVKKEPSNMKNYCLVSQSISPIGELFGKKTQLDP
jgi:hypothetical protein